MSILNVEHLSHGFGDRAIFTDVSFRLLKGEHIGLIGANGEGKSTFMNIITGKMMPDEGKVEWSKNVRVGYLDQHTVLEKGMTIRDVLKSAFSFLFEMEEKMNDICAKMGDASEEEMNAMMEELGTIQDLLMAHDFYIIDSKVEEIGRAFGLDEIGLDKDVDELSGGQRTKVLLGKLLLEKPDILLLDEPTNYLDVQHIEWLKRYLQDYENAFILISHDIPFLNSVVNLIYHMENQKLDRYVGDYDRFMEVYEMKKSQLEAAYNRQQAEIAKLQDFVARNKARVAETGRPEHGGNLFLLRAFTKTYAMAGLRLGYGFCTSRELLDRLETNWQPWSVSILAQEAGYAALSEERIPFLKKMRETVVKERQYLSDGLTKAGFTVFHSDANFLLFKDFKTGQESWLYEYFLERGILIRSCRNYRLLDRRFYRICVRSHEENREFLEILKDYR